MYRFFVEQEQLKESPLRIEGEDYRHIHQVLRMKPGEEVLISDGGEQEYLCVILEYDTEQSCVYLKITDVFRNFRELPAEIILFQGYPKGDKLETIVQKAVELGATEVVPVMMKRCVVKLDDKRRTKKVERLNAIALSAAKQSKRGCVPVVKSIMCMEEAVCYAKECDYLILPYENEEGMDYAREVIANARGKKRIGIFIGPEGGFEPEEVAMLKKAGSLSITLGHRILRTETAGMTVLSLLMFLLEQDEK